MTATPDDPVIIFASVFGSVGNSLLKSIDAGESWYRVDEGLSGLEVTDLAFEESDPRVVFAATDYYSIQRSIDGGETWQALDDPESPLGAFGLAWVPGAHPRLVAASVQRGIAISEDNGDTWSYPGSEHDPQFLEISVDPRDPDTIWGNSSSLYVSHDGGATWAELFTGSPPDTGVLDFAVNQNRPDELYASTEDGISWTTDGGATWGQINLDGPLLRTQELALGGHDLVTLHAAPYGVGGVWSATLNPPVLTTSCPLPLAVIGMRYEAQLAAESGSAPYTWAIAAEDLPPGIALDPQSGSISGRPTEIGDWTFIVRVVDRVGLHSDSECSLAVWERISIRPLSAPNGVAGTPYSLQLFADSGSPPHSWSLVGGELPPGLSLNNSTGEISGIPTKPGTWVCSVQAVGDQRIGQKQLSIEILNPSPRRPRFRLSPASKTRSLLTWPLSWTPTSSLGSTYCLGIRSNKVNKVQSHLTETARSYNHFVNFV